ncbi:MAG: CBS domain-containing protein [Chloroflexi bacterium]|nr:CBS domain-containing protein [Chloroflexota bacterium]
MLRMTPAARQSSRRFREFLSRRVERSPRAGPMVLAAIVGLGAGLAAVGFSTLVELSDQFFLDIVKDDWLGGLPDARLILIPAIGGLLVGPITYILAPGARGHSVPEVMAALDSRGGRVPATDAVAKIAAATITIGSGGALGRQGPVVFIGAAFGSLAGRVLRLSDQTMRLLAAAGAAGGVAGVFNAPIAGVFFALEVLLRRFSTRNFSVVVLASIVATVTAIALRGDDLAIPVPTHQHLTSVEEAPLYAVLGVLCGVVGVAFIRVFYWTEDGFARFSGLPGWLLPAVGGAIVGALALYDGSILGIREIARDEALTGEGVVGVMLALLLLKMAATSISAGAGGSGGVFFPALFIGAMAGGVFEEAAVYLLPDIVDDSGTYATVGMAAVFAAASRAPITSTLILVEMTDDFGLMVPLLISVTVATVVSQLLSSGTIYSIKAERLGVSIEEDVEPSDVMAQLRVSDAMSPMMVAFGPEATVDEITLAFEGDPDPIALVVRENGEIYGIITGADIGEALAHGEHNATAAEICSTNLRTIHPDQTLYEALSLFASQDVRALPVVEPDDPWQPIGLLRRANITQAYAEAVDRRAARARRRRLRPVRRSDNVRYLELRVTHESDLDGKLLSDIDLTEDAVIVAVRHQGATLIPRGHTQLTEGDRVTIIASAEAVAEVRALFEGHA